MKTKIAKDLNTLCEEMTRMPGLDYEDLELRELVDRFFKLRDYMGSLDWKTAKMLEPELQGMFKILRSQKLELTKILDKLSLHSRN
ncbi:MAG: hypothetical protein WC635_12465 [Bacteriovorax sp.]|jgi:hypothetical protein